MGIVNLSERILTGEPVIVGSAPAHPARAISRHECHRAWRALVRVSPLVLTRASLPGWAPDVYPRQAPATSKHDAAENVWFQASSRMSKSAWGEYFSQGLGSLRRVGANGTTAFRGRAPAAGSEVRSSGSVVRPSRDISGTRFRGPGYPLRSPDREPAGDPADSPMVGSLARTRAGRHPPRAAPGSSGWITSSRARERGATDLDARVRRI